MGMGNIVKSYREIKELLRIFLEKNIDVICSAILLFSIFVTWYPIDVKNFIVFVCIMMALYVLYYGWQMKKFGKWAALNIIVGFLRIAYLLEYL